MPRKNRRKSPLPEAFKDNIDRVKSGEIRPKSRKKAASKKTQGKRSKK